MAPDRAGLAPGRGFRRPSAVASARRGCYGPRKCHELEIDLGDIAVRQPETRRPNKINMSRGLRPYRPAGGGG
jgi:hypothetical protein